MYHRCSRTVAPARRRRSREAFPRFPPRFLSPCARRSRSFGPLPPADRHQSPPVATEQAGRSEFRTCCTQCSPLQKKSVQRCDRPLHTQPTLNSGSEHRATARSAPGCTAMLSWRSSHATDIARGPFLSVQRRRLAVPGIGREKKEKSNRRLALCQDTLHSAQAAHTVLMHKHRNLVLILHKITGNVHMHMTCPVGDARVCTHSYTTLSTSGRGNSSSSSFAGLLATIASKSNETACGDPGFACAAPGAPRRMTL
jgi:hypothetical protein